MEDPKPAQAMGLNINLPSGMEVGVYADFAAVWHTPGAFVVDFIVAKQPPIPQIGQDGQPTGQQVFDGQVSARVRIPPEQVNPIIKALTEQLSHWLDETGRSEPPEAWFPPTAEKG